MSGALGRDTLAALSSQGVYRTLMTNDRPLHRRIESFREWAHEWLHGLYHGMIEHPSFEKIEKEAEDVEDEFFFACFADAFGIPSPVSYYTVELLPYLTDEFEQWERRMWDRESLLERKGQQYHFH
jgi:hypothetical protein